MILIADKFDASGIADLESLGHHVLCDPSLSADSLPDAIADLLGEDA